MTAQIKEGSRVRVTVNRCGIHYRNFMGTVKGWSKSGLVRVVEDGQIRDRSYSSDNVKLTKQ